jgi:hypothetical protein
MPAMPDPSNWSYVQPNDADAADVDVVRFWLQDTDPNVRLLGDLELQYLIDVWMPVTDSIVMVAAQAAEIVATKFAGIVTVAADGVSVNVADISTRYSERAVALRTMAHQVRVGEIDITNLLWGSDWDWSIDPLNFGVGFQDNPEAGRQAYGTERWDYAHAASYDERMGWY